MPSVLELAKLAEDDGVADGPTRFFGRNGLLLVDEQLDAEHVVLQERKRADGRVEHEQPDQHAGDAGERAGEVEEEPQHRRQAGPHRRPERSGGS